eukprot:2976628-Pyramimonas_sp.AAC.1
MPESPDAHLHHLLLRRLRVLVQIAARVHAAIVILDELAVELVIGVLASVGARLDRDAVLRLVHSPGALCGLDAGVPVLAPTKTTSCFIRFSSSLPPFPFKPFPPLPLTLQSILP